MLTGVYGLRRALYLFFFLCCIYSLVTIIIIIIRLKELLDMIEAHIILKPDVYSIQNMLDVKNGELGKRLQNIIITCNKHVANCQVKIEKKKLLGHLCVSLKQFNIIVQLCQARGFICEICNKSEVLFPWNFSLVMRCVDCGSCYHKKCFDSRKAPICPRCPRIKAQFKRSDSQQNQNAVPQL